MKISSRYRTRTAEIYRQFAADRPGLDFSETALLQIYRHDSHGSVDIDIGKTNNGFFIGKFWMSVTINMWKEDINDGLLTKEELLNDFPGWFLNKIGIT